MRQKQVDFRRVNRGPKTIIDIHNRYATGAGI